MPNEDELEVTNPLDDDTLLVDQPKSETSVIQKEVNKNTFNPVPTEFLESDSDSRDYTLYVPGERLTEEQLNDILNQCTEEIKNSGIDSSDSEYLGAMIKAFTSVSHVSYPEEEFNSTFNRDISDFVQYILNKDGKAIRPGYLNFNISDDNTELDGLNAMRYVTKVTGVGNVTKIPLWHSGIVLTIDSFRERSMLNLNLAITSRRIDLGLNTRGANFNGDDVYIVTLITDFILEHVIDSTMKNWTIKTLKENILTLDIPALLSCALASIYPSGYPVYHPCKNVASDDCDYAITAERSERGDILPDSMLDFTKVLRVIKPNLHIGAAEHMSASNKTHKVKDIVEYQKELLEHNSIPDSLIYSDDKIVIRAAFKIPTLKAYDNGCKMWINGIVNMVENAISLDSGANGKERSQKRIELLEKYSQTLDLLKHVEWIRYLSISEKGQSEKFIRRLGSIKSSLEIFSELPDFKNNFNKASIAYKEKATVSFTAIPNFICPSCGTSQAGEDTLHPTLIPMNMVGYFFVIMSWRMLSADLAL